MCSRFDAVRGTVRRSSRAVALGSVIACWLTACGKTESSAALGASGGMNAASAGAGGGATMSPPSPCAGLTGPKRLATTQAAPSTVSVRAGVLAAASGTQDAADGAITVVDLASGATRALATSRSAPGNINLSSDFAYWTENGLSGNPLAGVALFRARLTEPSAIEVVVSGLDPSPPGPALVVAETLFFATGGALESLAPNANALVNLVPDANVLGLASDGQYLYWTSCGQGVRRVLASGGAPEVVAKAYCPLALAADNKDVYFLDGADPQGNELQGNALLYRVAASGGATTVATRLPAGATNALHLDASHVYFSSDAGLFRFERATGITTMIAGAKPSDFAIDDSCIYWADSADHGLYTASKSGTRSCQSDVDCPGAKCLGASATEPGACSKLLLDIGGSCTAPADCLSGFCVGGTCTGGYNGDVCVNQADCTGQWCVPAASGLGTCSDGALSSLCADDTGCLGHECVHPINAQGVAMPGAGVCSNGGPKQPCAVDADCAKGSVCIASGALSSVCYAGQDQDFCRKPSDCQSTFCVLPQSGTGPGKCESGAQGNPCDQAADCTSHFCPIPPSNSGGGPSYTCTSGALGGFCWTNDDCQSGYCAPDTKAGLCAAPP